ncbi:MAG: hypothetical protein ACRAUM_11010 [Exiguobacterium indicum]
MSQTGRASFFWKRYFYVVFPLFIFGISHESYLVDNPLANLEDIGEFVFFCLYLFNFAVLAALLTNLWWFFLPTKPAHSESDF